MHRIPPQLATLVDEVPRGSEWIHEIKFDGYRIICRIARGRATLLSRSGKDWTQTFSTIAEAAAELPVKTATLDGEVVSLAENGASAFQELQNSLTSGKGRLAYYLFDLLEQDGVDYTRRPLTQRKAALARLLGRRGREGRGLLRYTAHLEGDGEKLYRSACNEALEGIICKRKDRVYHPGRGTDWVKVKCHREQELVIGGYSEPKGGRKGFGALLLGVNERGGGLRYAGKVGTGFTDESLRDLHRRLVRLEIEDSPFTGGPRRGARGVHFVKPELVAQVVFTEWTADGHLRHPSFAGLREDKPARAVVREEERHVEEVERSVNPRLASTLRHDDAAVGGRTRAAERHLRSVRPHEPRTTERPTLTDGPLRVAGVAISHPHRMLYTDQGVTKHELATYYEAIADHILPHVAGRPLTLVRCPDGQGKPCFYQKHAAAGILNAVSRIIVKESHRRAPYLMVDTVAGLVSLVQLGVLELHVWGSRLENIEYPDRMVMDLDPGEGVSWARVIEGARTMRALARDLGLESFVKTTGGKGLHVVIPLSGKNDWTEVKEFALGLANCLVREEPDRYVAVMSKDQRPGKIFVDYLRNARGATAVAPYSSRARPGAPVAMPISWAALSTVKPDTYTIRSTLTALARRRKDPWADIDDAGQRLTAAMFKKLRGRAGD